MATSVKASAGMVYGYTVCNANTSAVYFRLFNLATAPTVGTSTPLLVDIVPASNCVHFVHELGLAYGSGIAFDVTSGSLSNGDTITIATVNSVSVSIFTE